MEFITKTERGALEGRIAALRANRAVISQRIAEARALGDLKENGDYHAAREQQGMEESEIRRLEERLSRAQVVEEGGRGSDVVFLGSTVKLRDVDKGDVDLFRLVGEASNSSDAEYVEVTASSPMGEALMKARLGEVIRVNAPRGVKRFEVVEIK
ncbi:MAG: transcription elongation factor GreA [Phycisphaerales bacterium]|nr:transcription elongation factor GreA [Phycisphaerales bacterium]